MSCSSPSQREEAAGERRNMTLVVGYALSPKKVDSFITPSLLNHAQTHGVRLIPIDLSLPLLNQGPPFHCILHKLSHPTWESQLAEFSSRYPTLPIIDPPRAVRRLHDRLSMLQVVSHLHLPDSDSAPCSFGIPDQIPVLNTTHFQNLLDNCDVEYPVIAKPSASNGTAKSHQMYLVFNLEGLRKLGSELEPPFVLQQFVNHGGVVFKVYVVGDHVHCVRRDSLPDYDSDNNLGLLPFSQISNLAGGDRGMGEARAAMPPERLVSDLAGGLRDALELNLFNFDLIRDNRKSKGGTDHYQIIDINYFPGYAKMPNYEAVFTDFLLRHLLHRHNPPPTEEV
ncbi:OLC1v1021034C1 [Oldenlandia corymbosa var. corymbosa]|uniref:Inositol-tetrakisphosphate 1-kinase n=1 Tax=Oldenlandia corymbosa var. corymbosa TaxID=529605 RepID=A0AAV1BUU1_OLDCO|nr:OLC1v1021034C1 [Oldenlandia corymbosa var. corymbosa]